MLTDKLVIGIFDDYTRAQAVIEALRKSNFKLEDISLIGSDFEKVRMSAVELQSAKIDKLIIWCGILGGILGWIAGLFALYMPGTSNALAQVPLYAAFASAAAGCVLGAYMGMVIHFDVPQYKAKVQQGHLTEGSVLVSVHTQNQERRFKAEEIMDQFGAREIDSRPEPMLSKNI